jgi:hypothetical protein
VVALRGLEFEHQRIGFQAVIKTQKQLEKNRVEIWKCVVTIIHTILETPFTCPAKTPEL